VEGCEGAVSAEAAAAPSPLFEMAYRGLTWRGCLWLLGGIGRSLGCADVSPGDFPKKSADCGQSPAGRIKRSCGLSEELAFRKG
jgi:hypothetical protein